MSKKLEAMYTPLQSLNNIRYKYFYDKGGSDLEYFWFNRVQTALKENIELKKMIQDFNKAIGEPQIIPPTIEKKLKALEIIKEKRVDTVTLRLCFEKYGLCEYNTTVNSEQGELPLTPEDYDILKEALS